MTSAREPASFGLEFASRYDARQLVAARSKLSALVAALGKHYGRPERPPPRAPLEWILWENVAYLLDDERRLENYRELEKRVGLTAEKLTCAPRSMLLAIAKHGGMQPEQRVDKLQRIAELALEHGGGDLRAVLELPPARARKILRQFPGIGEPGAERILMECGVSESLALDSNGLRVLARYGYGREETAYARTYRSVQQAIAGEIEPERAWLSSAHELLRTHGKTLCRRTGPDCGVCPLVATCNHGRSAG